MEFTQFGRTLKRRWVLIVVMTVIGAGVGFASAALADDAGEGDGQMYLAVHTLSTSGTDPAALERAAYFTTEGDVPKRAAEALGVDAPATLAQQVVAQSKPEVGVLEIKAVDADPAYAVQLADTFATELVGFLDETAQSDRDRELAEYDARIQALGTTWGQLLEQAQATTDPAEQAQLTQQYEEVLRQMDAETAARDTLAATPLSVTTLRTFSTAEAVAVSEAQVRTEFETQTKKGRTTTDAATDTAPSTPGDPNPVVRAGFGGFVGLLLGIALAFVLARIDPNLRTKEDAEAAFGWPVIAEIPPLNRRQQQQTEVITASEPRSRTAEAFRVLRSSLFYTAATDDSATGDDTHPLFAGATTDDGDTTPDAPAASDSPTAEPAKGRVVLVTSPGPAEGKTTTTANLAAVLAETGRKVLVVNCDFRRPRVHTYLDSTDEPRRVHTTNVPGVDLVTQVVDAPDDANPADVVRTQRQVIRNARTMYDVVLLDTAPVLSTSDAAEVLSCADQVVIVSRAGRTTKESADRAAELLERRNAPVVGVVLVGNAEGPSGRYYYYGSQGGRGDDDSSPLAALANAKPDEAAARRPAADTAAPAADRVVTATDEGTGDRDVEDRVTGDGDTGDGDTQANGDDRARDDADATTSRR